MKKLNVQLTVQRVWRLSLGAASFIRNIPRFVIGAIFWFVAGLVLYDMIFLPENNFVDSVIKREVLSASTEITHTMAEIFSAFGSNNTQLSPLAPVDYEFAWDVDSRLRQAQVLAQNAKSAHPQNLVLSQPAQTGQPAQLSQLQQTLQAQPAQSVQTAPLGESSAPRSWSQVDVAQHGWAPGTAASSFELPAGQASSPVTLGEKVHLVFDWRRPQEDLAILRALEPIPQTAPAQPALSQSTLGQGSAQGQPQTLAQAKGQNQAPAQAQAQGQAQALAQGQASTFWAQTGDGTKASPATSDASAASDKTQAADPYSVASRFAFLKPSYPQLAAAAFVPVGQPDSNLAAENTQPHLTPDAATHTASEAAPHTAPHASPNTGGDATPAYTIASTPEDSDGTTTATLTTPTTASASANPTAQGARPAMRILRGHSLNDWKITHGEQILSLYEKPNSNPAPLSADYPQNVFAADVEFDEALRFNLPYPQLGPLDAHALYQTFKDATAVTPAAASRAAISATGATTQASNTTEATNTTPAASNQVTANSAAQAALKAATNLATSTSSDPLTAQASSPASRLGLTPGTTSEAALGANFKALMGLPALVNGANPQTVPGSNPPTQSLGANLAAGLGAGIVAGSAASPGLTAAHQAHPGPAPQKVAPQDGVSQESVPQGLAPQDMSKVEDGRLAQALDQLSPLVVSEQEKPWHVVITPLAPSPQFTALAKRAAVSPYASAKLIQALKQDLCRQGICEEDYSAQPEVYNHLFWEAYWAWYVSNRRVLNEGYTLPDPQSHPKIYPVPENLVNQAG